MRIMSIQNSYNQPKTNFKSYHGFVRGTNHELFNIGADGFMYKPNTQMLRPSAGDLIQTLNFADKFFEHFPKVHSYFYGCSYGSEPISQIMLTYTLLGKEKAQKYLPAIAKDINPIAIDNALKGFINLEDDELDECLKAGIDIEKFMSYSGLGPDTMYGDPQVQYKLYPIITKNIKYSVANILDDYINIEPEGSFVFARNFWPYLRPDKQEELAYKLSTRLGKHSLLKTGTFDDSTVVQKIPVDTLLKECGFKEVPGCNHLYINCSHD